MEAKNLTVEELEELRTGYGVSRIFDPSEEGDTLEDFDVAARNYALYQTQRGRTCEYPDCEEKIRYTRIVPICGRHENTEFAECHPTAEPGSSVRPRLPGLRDARREAGVTTRGIASLCGRSHKWAQQVDRGRDGVPHDLRRKLAEALSVTEAELLEGRA